MQEEYKFDVSIIIVNYNTEQLTKDCINSIYNKTQNIKFEIIVVDNNSPDGINYLDKDSRIKLIKANDNLGFGKANNLGTKFARGKYLFFLNPDTILVNNAIYILYNHMEANPKTGICGGNLYSKEMFPCHSYKVILPGILYELNELLKGIPSKYLFKDHFNNTNKNRKVAYITGADLLIKKTTFEYINGFDKDFFMYFEETYLCHCVSKLKMNIINIPQAKIIHLEGKSIQLKEKRETLYYNGRSTFLKKCYSPFYVEICNIIARTNCRINIKYFKLKNRKELVDIWSFRLNQLNKNEL